MNHMICMKWMCLPEQSRKRLHRLPVANPLSGSEKSPSPPGSSAASHLKNEQLLLLLWLVLLGVHVVRDKAPSMELTVHQGF